MPTRPYCRIVAAILACLVLQTAAVASATDQPAIRFSGFGTLGAAHTQGHGAAFIRDLPQPHGADNRGLHWEQDSRLGIQANFNPTENLEGVAQVISRYRNDNTFKPELTWGFLKYTISDQLEVRAGRIGFDAYIGADTRDVGYSYLWVRPPVDYYGTLFFPYEDGGDLVFRQPLGNGVASVKIYGGITRQQTGSLLNQSEWAGGIQLGNIGSTLDLNGSRIAGGHVEFQNNHWIARLGISLLRLNKGFPPGKFDIPGMLGAAANNALQSDNPPLARLLRQTIDDTQVLGRHSKFKSFALFYEDGPLQGQFAVSHISSDSLLIPEIGAGFLTFGYRIGALTPYATLSASRTKRSQRGAELASAGAPGYVVDITTFMLSTPLYNQNTYSIGARYNLTDNLAFKFQLDHVRNKDCSPASLPLIGPRPACAPSLLWSKVPVPWNGRANIYSAVLDFTF